MGGHAIHRRYARLRVLPRRAAHRTSENYTRFIILSRDDPPTIRGSNRKQTQFYALSEPSSVARLVQRGKIVSVHSTPPPPGAAGMFPSRVLVEVEAYPPTTVFGEDEGVRYLGSCDYRFEPE